MLVASGPRNDGFAAPASDGTRVPCHLGCDLRGLPGSSHRVAPNVRLVAEMTCFSERRDKKKTKRQK